MKKRTKWLLALIIIGVIALLLFLFLSKRTKSEKQPEIFLSVANDLREMVRLTTIEGERIVPITYKGKGVSAFGIGHYRARISFDVENIQQAIQGDTIYLVLPEPQVQILEHEENGFTVYDVWGNNIATRIFGAKLSVADENEMKRKAMRQLQSDLRQDGTTERAKAEARELLHKMFGIVPGTVIVLDTPAALPPTAQPIPLDQPTLYIQKQDEIQ